MRRSGLHGPWNLSCNCTADSLQHELPAFLNMCKDLPREPNAPSLREHAENNVEIPNMIQGIFLNLGVLGSLGKEMLAEAVFET